MPPLTMVPLRFAARIGPGDDVVAAVMEALLAAEVEPADGDVLVLAGKVLSHSEGRHVDLSTVTPSDRACELAAVTHKDPRLVELVLQESVAVSRAAPGALIVRHRLGFVVAQAGIDLSNAAPPGAAASSGPWALLLPRDPDDAAARLRVALELGTGTRWGVVVTDSWGRPFRQGTVGFALGASGLPTLLDWRGCADLDGRTLQQTWTALADQVAATADLLMGQGAAQVPAVHVRGVRWPETAQVAAVTGAGLNRAPAQDLYA